jgi:hypothetical protein
LLQAYAYQRHEYNEIMRRFFKKNSGDPDVREFRAACLRQSIPEELLVAEAWEVVPEEIMGGGNQSLQMAIAEQLLSMLPLFDPQAKPQVFRDIVFAITQDAGKTKAYVPAGPQGISDSVHDAQLALGTIMAGSAVAPVSGENTVEVIEVWLGELARQVQTINQQGGVPESTQEMLGLQNLQMHTAQRVMVLAQDEGEKQRVKQYSDVLGKLANEVRAFGQRLQEKMAAQQANSGVDPKVMAEIQADMMKSQAKTENMRQSHAQRMAQREVQFQQKVRQDEEKQKVDIAAVDAETAAKIRRETAAAYTQPQVQP